MTQAKEQEPSIEEILESIRQIISEDDKAADAGPGGELKGPAPEPVDLGGPADDVLDLTEKIEEAMQAPRDEPPADVAVPLDLTPAPETMDSPGTLEALPPEPPIDSTPPPPPPAVEAPMIDLTETTQETPMPEEALPEMKPEEPVIVGDTAKVTEEALARMVSNLVIEREEEMRRRFGKSITLEDIVKELLRPMLRQWVDKNLPGMVERMVKKELDEIARRTLNP